MPGTGPRSALSSLAQSFLVPVAAALLFATPVQAGPGHGQTAAQSAAGQARALEAQSMTQELVGLSRRLETASTATRDRLLAETLALAEERRDLLGAMIGDSPGEVLKVAIPSHIAGRMPTEVQALLEQLVELEGELDVIHVDAADPADSRYEYFLEIYNGERFSLHFAKAPPQLLSGTAVRANGLVLEGAGPLEISATDGAMAIVSGDDNIDFLATSGNTTTTSAAVTLPELEYTFGAQRTAVILVNFQDNPTDKPWTKTQARDFVFAQASDFFSENSYGQTWLSGDVFGWYTLPIDSTACNMSGVEFYGKEAATNAGVDLSGIDRFVFVFPQMPCGFAGSARVGGVPTSTWINGVFTLSVVSHEIGHNLGLRHSRALDCNDGVIGNDCITREYGNTVDTLGYPGTVGHFNAFQKERLGWLGYDVSPPLESVGASGIYMIEPLETDGANPRALKVLRSTDSTSGQRTWYYLEYRQPLGFDAQIPTTGKAYAASVFAGTIFSLGTESVGTSSDMLDMTPGSEFIDHRDAALPVSQSYTDAGAGVTITTLSAGPSGLEVSVDFGGAPTCVHVAPQISLSPAQSLWVAPGTAVTYTATVTNKDSTACATSSFDLLAAVPTGWSVSFGAASLSVAPGKSGTAAVTVTSPANAADGFYDVTVSAENAADATATASATATYVVSAPVNSSPVAQNDNGATDQDTAVTIAVLANDSDPDGDALTVASVNNGSNGGAVKNADGTVTYTPNTGFSGPDSFSYTVSDGNGGSDTATVAVTVDAVLTNTPPVANNDSAATDQGVAVTVNVLANDSDPDGDALSVTSAGQGLSGSTVVNGDGSVTYTPDAGFSGSDSFVYTVSDGNGGSSSAGVSVSVTAAPNQAPLARNDSAVTDEAKPVTIGVLANDSDPDGDVLSVVSIVQGSGGFASANSDGTVTYAPKTGFTGTDSFGYTVSDGRGGSDSATVTVTVNDVNLPPVAVDDSATTMKGTPVTIAVLANDSDPDGDALALAAASNGTKGTVTINADGTLTYTPSGKGKDSLTYRVLDTMGNGATATVTVTIKNAKGGGGGGGGGNGKGKPSS